MELSAWLVGGGLTGLVSAIIVLYRARAEKHKTRAEAAKIIEEASANLVRTLSREVERLREKVQAEASEVERLTKRVAELHAQVETLTARLKLAHDELTKHGIPVPISLDDTW